MTGIDQIASIGTGLIAANRKCHGISTQIIGHIKNVRIPFNVDIGVGDVIVPGAKTRTIETQLDDFRVSEIMTYPLESAVDEKLDAVL